MRHYHFLAYVKQDFYARRFLKIEPDWQCELHTALSLGVRREECDELFKLLGVECPDMLII